ncbi:MAG: V-type ATP synthase subunit D, partial [Nitrospinota bacterium]
MILNVSPNRMELLKLRRRLEMARRGHKLLKDKLDALIREFIDVVRRARDLRREVEARLVSAYGRTVHAFGIMSPTALRAALATPASALDLGVERASLMS